MTATELANGHAAPVTLTPLHLPQENTPNGAEQPRTPPNSRERPAVSVRVIESCYVLMAAVTIIATGVGFWLSYAGLHSFAVLAGLSGPEAWAWPASVDLFILAGELGITISTLRDGRPDWRAWCYFAAGCGPSVAFNVLHVTSHFPPWGKYAVAATPPIAAVLALAALMQQVIGLPDALAHMHARQQPVVTPRRDSDHDKKKDGRPQRKAAPRKPAAAMTNKELADREGVSVRTLQRRRNAKTGSTT